MLRDGAESSSASCLAYGCDEVCAKYVLGGRLSSDIIYLLSGLRV